MVEQCFLLCQQVRSFILTGIPLTLHPLVEFSVYRCVFCSSIYLYPLHPPLLLKHVLLHYISHYITHHRLWKKLVIQP